MTGFNIIAIMDTVSQKVLTFEEAKNVVDGYASEVVAAATEHVSLLNAVGRVLAQEIVADRDLPAFNRSARDGFAVKSADVANAPAKLSVVGELRAGVSVDTFGRAVEHGEAVEVMTGAVVPDGSDSVVMVEYTSHDGAWVEIQRGVEVGENIVPSGSEARRSDVLVEPGVTINPAVIAMAASVGCAEVEVFRRPRIAVLSTGDELVGLSDTPKSHQIRNSNSYSIASQVLACGAEPCVLPVAPDNATRMRELIAEGLKCEMLIMTGGVSMGKHDLVEPMLATFDADFFFTGAKIQPGKPVVFLDAQRPGTKTRIPAFGLPGNPVSTMVTFELFVRPVLRALCGARPKAPYFVKAELATELRAKTGLTRFLPARASVLRGKALVEKIEWQGSGDVVSAARSNCYLVVPPDREVIAKGEMISIFVPGVEF